MSKSRWVLVSCFAAVLMVSMAVIIASSTKVRPQISESVSTPSPATSPVQEQPTKPNLDWVRGVLIERSNSERLARLKSVAESHPEHLVGLINDQSLEARARERGAQVLVQGLSDENLHLLSPILVQPAPWTIKRAVLLGLMRHGALPFKSEILSVAREYSSDARYGSHVIELILRVWATLPDPDGESARTLQKYVEQVRTSGPRMRDLLVMVEETKQADPVLVAGAVDLIVAQLPETTTDEINAKNRFVAQLMGYSSDAASTVLESIAMGTSGRHAKSQAIHALGNKPFPKDGEILLRIVQESPDRELATEAAHVLRRVKSLSAMSGLTALRTTMDDGLALESITLAASMLEVLDRNHRSHELIATAIDAAARFKGQGGIRERDLKLHLAEYDPDPVRTLKELYPDIGWRILKSSAVQITKLPGMTELLADVFRNEKTPDSQRVYSATLLGNAGDFERVSRSVFKFLEEGNGSPHMTRLATLVRKFGEAKDKDRLMEYIESLPQGPKRMMLERGVAD